MISRASSPLVLRWRDIVEPGEQFHVARPQHTRRTPVPLHTHDFAELFWVDRGEGWQVVNGHRVRLSPGDVWFIRATDAHAFEVSGSSVLAITNVAFPIETADFLRKRYFSAAGVSWWWSDGNPAPVQVDPMRLHALNTAADRLALAPRDRLYIEHFLLGVFTELGARCTDADLIRGPDWLSAACRGIHQPEHFREGLPAFFRLAAKCPEHVARVMRKVLDTTPSDYLNTVRLTHAAFQLRMTSRSVTEIAMDAGYENLSYFFYVFKKKYGYSPRAYRRKVATP